MSRTITHIVIHCADTPAGRRVLPADVDAWHKQRGFQRTADWRKRFNPDLKAIGYHYLIDIDGQIYTGRHPDEVGAHVQGHNANSIGICLAGEGRYTMAQWVSLHLLVDKLLDKSPAKLLGHRDFPGVSKTCPKFDVASWVAGGMEPLAGHIFEAKKES